MRLFAHGEKEDIKTLHPAYFAMVMATGIVSIAMFLNEVPILLTIFLYLNTLFFIGLVIMTGIRFFCYRADMVKDIKNTGRGMGYFTIIAGTATLGIQFIVQTGLASIGLFFWVSVVIIWFIITYGLIVGFIIKKDKPTLKDGLNGAWLVMIVAAQSLVILTMSVIDYEVLTDYRSEIAFLAIVIWLSGGALYFWVITLIFYRFLFIQLEPSDITPPYWINTGAVAISTLAGAMLYEHTTVIVLFGELGPFIQGFTLFFWAIASWWIPILFILGFWYYFIAKKAFAYTPLYWGAVFPLGMYSACTYHLHKVIEVSFLLPLSKIFAGIALIAWIITFIGYLDCQVRSLRRTSKTIY